LGLVGVATGRHYDTENDRQAAGGGVIYAPRGSENTGSWWFETVDLSDIYRRAWPGDDAGQA